MLRTPRTRSLLCLVALVATGIAALPAAAWTPKCQQLIAEQAARLTPPDLYRQLARNRLAYFQGTSEPFKEKDPARHMRNEDGSGTLDQMIATSIDQAILAIELHRPFNEISYRLGVVSHYLADANNPLNASDKDAEEARYFSDFLFYLESAEPRMVMVFYGFRPSLTRQAVPGLVSETLARSRQLYPMVGREYRRVGFTSGRRSFDDRSTAFAVGSLSFSHAVSDIAEVLRYIWLQAGGTDSRRQLPMRGQEKLQLPRLKPIR